MSKRSIDKQVYEQYVDATVALFMEHYAVALGDATMQTKAPELSCSETLDLRCMTAIRKECAKLRRKEAWKSTKRVLCSAAVLLIALLSLSSVLFMTVEAFRVPVIYFFIEQGDGFWAITGKNDDDPIDPATSDGFDPNDPLAGLLPEGYTFSYAKQSINGSTTLTYKNANGDRLILLIRLGTSDLTIDREDAPISKKCKVAESDGVFVVKDGFTQLAWVNPEKSTSYLLNADALDEDTLVMIAEKLMQKMSK